MQIAPNLTVPVIVRHRFGQPSFSTLAGFIGMGLGVMVLFGWLIDSPILKSILPQSVAMKPNTAVCFVLMGSGLAMFGRTASSTAGRRLGFSLVLSAAIVALLTGSEYVTGVDLHIDQLLFGGRPADLGGVPGRMAPLTALCFSLLGAAAVLASLGRGIRAVVGLTGATILVSALSLFGFAFSATAPTFLAGYSAMAVHTAIGMCVLALGILGLLGSAGPFRPLAGRSETARVFRRLLIISVVLPVILAWLRLQGEALGFYDTAYGTSILLVGVVGVVCVAILRAAGWAWELELRREVSEAERDEFFQMSLDMLVVMGSDGRFRRVNQAWIDTFGFAAKDVVGRPWSDFIHPDDLDITIAEAQQNLVVGRPAINFANRYRCSDGTYRWLEWVSRKSSAGPMAFAVARDITERRRVEDRRKAENRALEAHNTTLVERAARDPLTGLLNRRSFDSEVARLEHSWHRRRVQLRPPVAVVMFDLDHFGAVNKAHGHQAGDAVLVRFAEILIERFRERDLVVRYGGEEFVAILPGATSADAIRIADDIRESFGATPIDIGDGMSITVTVSAGCAALADDRVVADALSVADVWLSQAKRSGRNQVVGL